MTALSGVGRTTFYECFDDFEHALRTVRDESVHRIDRALSSDTGGMGLVELCGVWLGVIAEEPVSALVALELQAGEVESKALRALRQALVRLFPNAAVHGDALMHATACADASARALLLAALGGSTESSSTTVDGHAGSTALPETMAEALSRSIGCLLADKF